MIKINLLKSFGANSSDVLKQIEEQKQIQIVFVKKFLVMFLGILGLFLYESYMIPELMAEQQTLQGQFSELTQFNEKREALKVEIEKYEKDRARLNRQTDFLQKIQRERIQVVEFISQLKATIPANVWINSLKIDGQFIEIKGEADSDKEINDFNTKLSSVNFLKDVVVLSIELRADTKESKIQIKNFVLKAQFAPPKLSTEGVGS
jgi:Tfp pilus assembly protein PilN